MNTAAERESKQSTAMSGERQRLVVFSDDWGRHPSSCQHLVRHLLMRRDVVWFNTIGMRPPQMDWATVRRGLEKLAHWRPRRAPRALHEKLDHDPQPRIVNPLMWPSFRSRWGRGVNRRLLSRAVQSVVGPAGDATILTTIPVVADLVGLVRVNRWVYYCVDDFSSWPGLDGVTMGTMEGRLVEGVDQIVSAGENLAARMKHLGRESNVLTHGVDLEFWRGDTNPEVRSVPTFTCEGPVVMFWGLIDRRLDLNLLRALSERMTLGTIVLVGPEQDPAAELKTIPRIRRLGPVPFDQLPALATTADVLVMPYADLPVTRAMQPLKLKEYLATGKPVVVRQLPATSDWNDCLDAVTTPDAFADVVLRRIASGTTDGQHLARKRLAAESWQAKAEQFDSFLFPAISGPHNS